MQSCIAMQLRGPITQRSTITPSLSVRVRANKRFGYQLASAFLVPYNFTSLFSFPRLLPFPISPLDLRTPQNHQTPPKITYLFIQPHSTMSTRQIGTVKAYDDEKRFGWITSDSDKSSAVNDREANATKHATCGRWKLVSRYDVREDAARMIRSGSVE